MNKKPPKEWLNDREVAARLGIHRITVWNWAKERHNGFPAAVRLSARVTRWSYIEILAWEAAQRSGGVRAA